ncbi:MAG: tandem-95 repeat protein, partial [Novosphingobium sp.]
MDYETRHGAEPEFGSSNLVPDNANAAVATAAAIAGAIVLLPDAANAVVLPQGASLDDIQVRGRDLIIDLGDGRIYVIPDGAVHVPEIVIDDVAVPPLNLAALLIGQEPAPAAGAVQSSGGNFADPLMSLQNPYDLGDLLPYTELAFPDGRERDHGPAFEDDGELPGVGVDPGGSSGVTTNDAIDEVREAGLLAARAGTIKSAGSAAGSGSNSTNGTIIITSPDGVRSVTINGITVTGAAGQQIVTDKGTLVLGATTGNQISYVYTLNDNTSGDAATDRFTVIVTDTDGDTGQGSLTINIVDDTPTARNDTDTVPGGLVLTTDGNVITGANTTSGAAGIDTLGADGTALAVTGIHAGTTGAFLQPGSSVQGQYGTLTIAADGSYTYVRSPRTPGGVTDTFTYRVTDGDGDTSTATLVITIGQSPVSLSLPTAYESTVVDESGLPARGDEPAGSRSETSVEIATGTINIIALDGIASVTLNGQTITGLGQIITLPSGLFTVTGYDPDAGTLSYAFVLTDNTSGDDVRAFVNITVTDTDGDTVVEQFRITVVDDAPTAQDDTDTLGAGDFNAATGNVITDAEGDGGADVQGADGAIVTAVAGAGKGASDGIVGGATAGLYGTLTLNADGSYTYVRNPGTPGGVSDVFNYTITDGDGDESSATLTIDIADSKTTLDLPVEGGEGTIVAEAGLPNGSASATDAEKTSGVFEFTAPDGPATVTIAGVAVTSVGQTFNGDYGTLVIDSIAHGKITYTYTLTTNTSGDFTSDGFEVTVTDIDGDNSAGTLTIQIVDDVPTARSDADSVTEDGATVADGNVITGTGGSDANATDGTPDTRGADGAAVSAVGFGATAGTVGSPLAGAYGTLTLNADGSYSYTLNNELAAVQGLDGNDTLTEIFSYVLTDGDNDTSPATLTITINGADDEITINGLSAQGPDLTVYEDDLSDGTSPNAGALVQTGTFTVNGADGIASIRIQGTETFVGQSFTTAHGTFTITGLSAPANGNATAITVSYSYTLTDNTTTHTGVNDGFLTETFAVAVTDTDGSTDTDTVEVRIVDDGPQAIGDGTFTVAEGTPLTISALANDIRGADGIDLANPAKVFVVTGPAKGSVVYNNDGTFTYSAANGAEGPDSFTYRIVDRDGDISTATVTLNLAPDSVPTIVKTVNAVIDEDGLPGANIDNGQANPTEVTSTGSALGGGSVVVNFGGDVPANLSASIVLLDTVALDGQLKTLNNANVTFALEGGALVGRSGGAEVVRITVSGASTGPLAGDVTYTYQVQLSQPVKHAVSGSEDSITLTGVGFTVTDNDGDPVSGSFNVTVVDDVPSIDIAAGTTALIADESLGTTGSVQNEGGTVNNDETAAGAEAGAIGYAKGMLFTTTTADAGADGAASRVYGLSVNNADSGMLDAVTNQKIILSLTAGGVIEGRTQTGGALVFKLSVNTATGEVTLNQFRAIEHNDSTNH